MKSINPNNGEIIKEYQEMSLDEVSQIIEQAHESFLTWRYITFEKKSVLMKQAAEVLREKSRE